MASNVHLSQINQMIEARGGLAGFRSVGRLRDLLIHFRRVFNTSPRDDVKSIERHGGQGLRPSVATTAHDTVSLSTTLRKACPSYFSEQEGKLEKPICLAVLKRMRQTSEKTRHVPHSYEDTTLAVTKRLPDVRDPGRNPERATLLWVWLISTDAWRWAQDFEEWRNQVWTSWYTYFA